MTEQHPKECRTCDGVGNVTRAIEVPTFAEEQAALRAIKAAEERYQLIVEARRRGAQRTERCTPCFGTGRALTDKEREQLKSEDNMRMWGLR